MIMKQIFFFLAFFSLLLTASCKRSSTIQDLPFAVDSVGNQVLVITHADSSFAAAAFYVHTPEGWRLDRSGDAFVGKMGVGKMREGDARTPLGYLGILSAFGIQPNPGTQIPYIDVTPTMVGVDCEGEYYNQIVDTALIKVEVTGENMHAIVPEYNFGLTTTYNQACVPGFGSCLFIHCKGSKPYTGGCVALDEDFMKHVLQVSDTTLTIYIR